MSGAVRGMLGRSLGALIFRNVVLAGEVLESDDVVDRYRDQIFEKFAGGNDSGTHAGRSTPAVCTRDEVSRTHRGSRYEYC